MSAAEQLAERTHVAVLLERLARDYPPTWNPDIDDWLDTLVGMPTTMFVAGLNATRATLDVDRPPTAAEFRQACEGETKVGAVRMKHHRYPCYWDDCPLPGTSSTIIGKSAPATCIVHRGSLQPGRARQITERIYQHRELVTWYLRSLNFRTEVDITGQGAKRWPLRDGESVHQYRTRIEGEIDATVRR